MIRVLTYNIEFGKNLEEIYKWLASQDQEIDIICLQEFPEKELVNINKIAFLRISKYFYSRGLLRNKEQLGQLIIIKNPDFKMINENKIEIGVDNLERFYKKEPTKRSALSLIIEYKGIKFIIVNVHLSAMALNKTRKEQIAEIFKNIEDIPTIILGDFNYSSLIKRNELVKFMSLNNFIEAGEKMITNLYKGKISQQLDYVFYKNLILENIEVKDVKFSDHYPIFAKFRLSLNSIEEKIPFLIS
jgi:endonuclease/exonuclease/phosphatase family metal-dependent hydrolase